MYDEVEVKPSSRMKTENGRSNERGVELKDRLVQYTIYTYEY